ncbi:hypothetical protein BDW59DRAFT_161645 [Aspergillus cavernicola]|uniref:SWIM-type domain-containing protein n=1 Tax=Aspergillus cavernicola TaxID=176166 RepID=A0ABR4IDR4_9EURO
MADLNMNVNLPQTNQFINNLLFKLSQYTTSTISSRETETERENGPRHYPRQTQPQPQPPSAFPNTQLTHLKPLMLTLHCIFPNEFLLALDILDRGLVRRVRTLLDETELGNRDELGNEDRPGFKGRGKGGSGRISEEEDFFFVTSASTIRNTTSASPFRTQIQRGTPHHHHQNRPQWQEKGYEVRLQAWNCTCPAFSISAFRDLGPEPEPESSSRSPHSSSSENQPENEDEDMSDNDSTPHRSHADDANINAQSAADDKSKHPYSFGGTFPLHPESAPAVCKHILACLMAALCPGLGLRGEDGSGGKGRFVTLGRGEVAALCAGWGG